MQGKKQCKLGFVDVGCLGNGNISIPKAGHINIAIQLVNDAIQR